MVTLRRLAAPGAMLMVGVLCSGLTTKVYVDDHRALQSLQGISPVVERIGGRPTGASTTASVPPSSSTAEGEAW
jgi:hypothetical protein